MILRAIAHPKLMPKDSWFLQLRLSDESYQQALESLRIQSQNTEQPKPKHSDIEKLNALNEHLSRKLNSSDRSTW